MLSYSCIRSFNFIINILVVPYQDPFTTRSNVMSVINLDDFIRAFVNFSSCTESFV